MRKYILATLIVLCLAGCAKTPSATEPSITAPTVSDPTISTPVITDPPITEPPATDPPATEPPPTEPPVTEPPVTAPPLEGWKEIDGEQYYYENGQPHTGWLEQDGNRYYFHSDGTMATGKVVMPYGDEVRYFTSTGKEVILVNPWNFVPDDYSVELEEVDGYKVAAECASALKKMLKDCEEDGFSASIVSTYRTHEYQADLFQRRIDRFIAQGYDRETAQIEAAKRVAFPGTSEHELGLAIDITDSSYQTLDKKQEESPAQQWLMAHCWEYGFILRYPNEKTEVTGIIYEPWHYRYVGTELALELRDTGLCLEEYLEALTKREDAWSDFALTLDSVNYQLPCDYTRFAEDGWVIDSDHAALSIPAHTSMAVHLHKDNKTIMVNLSNPSNSDAPTNQCQVDGLWLFSDYGNIPFALPGGISMSESSAMDILATYGCPDDANYYGIGNDDYDPQGLSYLRYEADGSMEHSIAFHFDEAFNIIEIEIKNDLPDSE